MANDIWTRGYLRGIGYRDEEIGFDPNSQNVLVRGQPLAQATRVEEGRSYAPAEALQKAYEANRLSLGPGDAPTRYRAEGERTLADVLRMSREPFKYDPETDPRFQQASKVAQRQALVALNQRGLLRGESSYAPERLAQVTGQLLPQFYNQARQERSAELARQLSAATALLGQAGQAETARESQRQFNINAAKGLAAAYGVPVEPKTGGAELFEQVRGRTPISARKSLSDITGVDPVTGEPTVTARNRATQLQAALERARRVRELTAKEKVQADLLDRWNRGEQLTREQKKLIGVDIAPERGLTLKQQWDIDVARIRSKNDAVKAAVRAAQDDMRFLIADTPEKRQEIINEWVDTYSNLYEQLPKAPATPTATAPTVRTPTGAPLVPPDRGAPAGATAPTEDPTWGEIADARASNMSDAEIAALLRRDGKDPVAYGIQEAAQE